MSAEAKLKELGIELPPAPPKGGVYKPVPGKFEGRRPVYACDAAGLKGREGTVKYSENAEKWYIETGDERAWSLAGCAAAVPEDVEHWEYDDGHSADYAIDISEVVVTTQE